MVTEGAIGRLKYKFRVLHKKCESDKETVKPMALACVVLHNICIDRGDLIPRVFDLFCDSTANNRRERETIWELLYLTDTRLKRFRVRKKISS